MHHCFRLLITLFSISLVSLQSKALLSSPVNTSIHTDSDKIYLSSRLDSLEVFNHNKNWEGIIDLTYTLENFAELNNDQRLLTQMIMLRASSFQTLGNYNQALTCYLRLLDIHEQNGDSIELAKTHNSIGRAYTDMGDYTLALKYIYNGIGIADEASDFYSQALLFYSASIVHYFQNDMERCKFSLEEAEDKTKLLKNNELRFSIQEMKGLLMLEQKDYIHAHKQLMLSLSGYKNLGDSLSMANTFDNLGRLSREQGKFQEAIEYFNQSLRIRSNFRSLNSLPTSYHNLAETYFRAGNLDSSLRYADKSIMLSSGFKMLYQQSVSSVLLANIYQKKGDFTKAYHWISQHNAIHDNIFSPQNTRTIVQMEANREFEKKFQQQTLEREKEELLLMEKNKRSKLIGMYLGISALMAIGALIIALRSYNMKRKHTKLLEEQKEEIMVQNEEITAQQESLFEMNEELLQKNETISAHLEEIELQRDSLEQLTYDLQEKAELIEKQRDILFRQKKELTDSILYAERIQQACLPTRGIVKDVFPDSFVFYKPKNIISGDFYLINNVRGYKIFAVGDCTGHGVPGGLLSMLGIAYLNDIINKDHVTTSSEVLEEMRRQIIHSLHQNSWEVEAGNNDGMDMAVCALNTDTMELQFSGANIPIYIFKKNNGVIHDTPIVLKEDRMPISQYIKNHPFSNKSVKVDSGDMIYMFTDGFSDQFGEKNGKKFNISRFRSLLASIHHLDPVKQHEIISSTFDEWKGDHSQIDDVLVMGLRV